MIHSKVLDHEKLEELQRDIILILCQLKMYFPPSFFDVMVHLVSYIVEEIKIVGPVFLRYMYPFKRYMGFLKGYVRNRYRPEGSIFQGYAAEEVVQFCTNYMDDVTDIGLPQPRHQGTRTRRLISILKKNWKDVTREEKNFLWSDIKAHFRLENDDVKKQTLLSCGTKWKAFKTRLRVKFMLKNVSPLMKWTHIKPNVWDQFGPNENTAAKNKLRTQARARGQKQITRPRVGLRGYRDFEKQWEEERNDPDKATELHLILDLRSSNYCLARAPCDRVGIKLLPAELIDVSNKLNMGDAPGGSAVILSIKRELKDMLGKKGPLNNEMIMKRYAMKCVNR
nr:hypothetical protein CTI12_AA077290 [Tanacetum cinerariifolium]